MSYYNTIALWTVFLVYNYVKCDFSECSTPDMQAGECKLITECETIPFVRSKQKTKQQLNYLRKSHCGFEGMTPKICCPLPKELNGCVNTNDVKGVCTDILNCTYISAAISTIKKNEIYNFIATYTHGCNGTPTDNLRVCCPPSAPVRSLLPTSTPLFVQPTPPLSSQISGRGEACSATSLPPDPNSGCCGVDASSTRIFGGSEADIEQYPWLALIEYLNSHTHDIDTKCGGSLISGRYALTAAHCVDPAVIGSWILVSVRLGEHDTRTDKDCVMVEEEETCNDGAISVPIQRIMKHPVYKPSVAAWHDIALLRLNRTVAYSYFIKPICLPSPTADVPTNLYVAGWGVANNGFASSVKLQLMVPYVNLTSCRAKFSHGSISLPLWEGQVCAGGELGKDTCKGDSGGPLMRDTKNWYEILGIISFGSRYCGIGYPGVYTNVTQYLQWIKNKMHD